MKILVLGASGMLGHTMVRVLSERTDWNVYGTLRNNHSKRFFETAIAERLIGGCDVENHDALTSVFGRVRPDVVINCIGLIKQLAAAEDPLQAISINALLPHQLANLCMAAGARLIHMSTDCVFSGTKGLYSEDDPSDAKDMYGKSKFLGETHYPHTITLRTSIIGHELGSCHGLVEWFLSQKDSCKGFKRAIFSGLPTVALAQLIRDVIISRTDLSGLYQVAADPISKYDLLTLIASTYGKSIVLVPDEQLVIDRSLKADRFLAATGYTPPSWPELIQMMHSYK